jgi:cytidylate kinase
MNAPVGFDSYLTFINCQLQPPGKPAAFAGESPRKSAVTISRQSGCGAHVIAEKLAQHLQACSPKDAPPWTVFDHNLVEKVLAEHNLPERLARFMPEDRVLEINDIMDELFGLHPPSWTLVQQTSETILHLAELGNVIILGHGAYVITAKLPHVFHVRVVASLDKRIEHMQQFEGLSKKAATERIQREDRGRERYLKKHFGKNIDDPLLYHMVINTDLISLDDAARLIGDAVLHQSVAGPARSQSALRVA